MIFENFEKKKDVNLEDGVCSRSSSRFSWRRQGSLSRLSQDFHVSHRQDTLAAPHLISQSPVRLPSYSTYHRGCNLPGLQTSFCRCVVLEQQIRLNDRITNHLTICGIHLPLRKETSIGVCAVKLNFAFAAPSMFRSFLERVLT